MSDCPACGEKVKPGVAVCKHCGAILDAEKAAKHGLVGKSLQHSANVGDTAGKSGAPADRSPRDHMTERKP
jgi:transposase